MSVERLRGELIDAGVASNVIERRIEFEASKKLRERALNIARTETMASSNAGQLGVWRQGRSEGLIAPELVKEWIVTPDDRLCELCEALEGEQREVDEAFSFGGMNPPLHPSCRCAVGLERQR